MAARLVEQFDRLVRPTLTTTQLAEPRERRRQDDRSRLAEIGDRRLKLRIGFRPLTSRDQHAPVLQAARRHQDRKALPRGELAQSRAPLSGAVVVADAITGAD